MAILAFKVQADYEKVVRLREEIAKLENQLKSFGRNTPIDEIKAVENKLAEAKSQFAALSTEAAKAGATISSDFKSKIYEASQTVNGLTREIIEQKAVVRGHESDLKGLKDAYRNAMSSGSSNASSIKKELDAAKHTTEESKAVLFDLTQEQAKAKLKVKELKEEYASFKDETRDTTDSHDDFMASLKKMAGSVIGITALKSLASQVVAVRGQFQDMETAIETLVGKDMANKLMPQIKEMAKISPLTMTDIVGAEKMMLGFNIEADKTIDYLKALSDVSMGNSQKFNSLTLAFSQMSAAGRLLGQDLNQFINAGFNPLQIIAEKTGKSIAQLKEEMSKGAISAEMVQQAFLDATSAGGKFYNMSENASKTINGQISMMQDAMDAVFNEIGTKTEGVIIKGIQMATALIQNYEKIGKVLVGLVTTYGAYRTAVIIATAASEGLTIAELALTKVRVAAKAAQDALNKAMLTNPYVAATVAIAALVTAMWTLCDSTATAERRQRAYNDEKEKAERRETEHANAIQGLIDKVRDETQAETERIMAMDALQNEYPSIFEQYDIEKLKLADILALKKQINEQDAKRKKTERIASIADIDERVAELREAQKYAGQSAAVIQSQIDDLLYKRDQLEKEHQANLVAEFKDSLSDKSQDQLQAYLKQIEAGAFKLDGKAITTATRDELKKAVGDAIEKINKAGASTYLDEYRAAEREWNEAKAALEAIEKDKDNFTRAQYDAAVTRKKSAENNFKKLGGDTTGKGRKAEADAVKSYNEKLAQEERVKQLEDSSAKERARTAKDMEFMVEQARIAAMQEGSEKRRAQRELDNKKELEDIDRRKQDYIDKVVEQEKAIFDAQEEQKAKNDKKYKKQTFDRATAESNVDTKAYDDARALTEARQKNQQDEVLGDLLSQYKSYEDKKQEITIAYLNESDELQAQYEETGDERYKRSLDERHRAFVQSLFELEKSYDTSYETIFRDPSKMTKDGLNSALDLAERKLRELIETGAEADVIDPLYEQIKAIREELDNYDISGITTDLMSLVRQADNLSRAKKRLEQLEEGSDLYKKEKEAIDRAERDLKKSLVATGVSEFSSLMMKAADAMHQIAEESGDVEIEELAKTLRTAGDVFNSAIQGFLQAGPWGLLVGLVSSAIGAIVNLAIEAEAADARMANSLASFRREIQLTQLQIDSAEFENIFGTQQFEMADEALQKAKDAIKLFKEESEKLGSLKWKYGTGVNWLPEQGVLFETYDKMEGLATKDIWDENGLLDIEKARAFLETSETITEEARKQVEYAIELREAYDAAQKMVDDFLSSLVGSTATDLTDAIFEGIDNGSDAWDIFSERGSETIRSLGKEMLRETIQKDLTDVWSNKLRESAGDANALASTYSEMMEWLKSQMGAYQDTAAIWEEQYGHLYQEADTSQQTASRKGYETLSEDTGNELVGRAIAQYESNLRMEEATRSMKESVDIMAANQVQIRDIAAESRAIIADSFLELQQIRENTGAIIKPIQNLSDKIDSWDSYIKSL